MNKKRILRTLLVSALLFAMLSACTVSNPQSQPTQSTVSQDATPAATFGQGITVASMAETPSVAPARHSALIGSFKNAMTHNGLFRLDYETLTPVPDLVSEWVPLSDTLFEVRIREGVMFHNGEFMTAYDIAASLEYVRSHPDQRGVHDSLASWEVVDRYTLLLDTGVPNALLLSDLASHGNFIMPRTLIDAGHDFTAYPIGSGPFVFEEWRAGDFLRFRAFDNYFDADRFPQIEYVHWRIIPEGSSRTIALESGEIDYAVDVAFPDVARLESNPDITVQQVAGATFQHFIMNNDRPQFDNIYVRRAIDMALDRDAMIMASLDGFGVPIWTSMPPNLAGASTDNTRHFNPDAARALLAEHSIDPAALDFEILIFDEQQRRRAEVAQANLGDIGIAVTISMIDFATWLTLTLDDTYDATFANFTTTNMVSFFRSTMTIDFIGSQNRSRMRNEEFSNLVSEAIVTVNEIERNAILEEASRIANDHAGILGINMSIVVRAFNSNLVAPELSASGAMFMNMMYWSE